MNNLEQVTASFQKFYKYILGDVQASFLAKVLAQYPPIEVLKCNKIYPTEENSIIDNLTDIPALNRKLPCTIEYSQFFENDIVVFNHEKSTMSVTVASATMDQYYRVSTGYLFSIKGVTGLLFYTKSGCGKPILVDSTSAHPLFLEFNVKGVENVEETPTTTITFDMLHFIVTGMVSSQTSFQKAAKYFAKSGVLANYRSNSWVNLDEQGYLDANQETLHPTVGNVLVLPRKRTIGELIPLYGKIKTSTTTIYNPSWEYSTGKASFMYPQYRIPAVFVKKDEAISLSKNGGFNGCFYEIVNYADIVKAFKELSKLRDQIELIKNRINVKNTVPQAEKKDYIAAVVQRCQRPKDLNAIISNLPKTLKDFPPLDPKTFNLLQRIDAKETFLRNTTPVRQQITETLSVVVVPPKLMKKRKIEEVDDEDVDPDANAKKAKLLEYYSRLL